MSAYAGMQYPDLWHDTVTSFGPPDAVGNFVRACGSKRLCFGSDLGLLDLDGQVGKVLFAVAESETGVDGFRFWDRPVDLPVADPLETNVYDMRLTRHEDGWIYGVFCTERKDPDAPPTDMSAAVAQCGIARTKDLLKWDRLADFKSPSPQQRNVVLHPEFVDGKYAFYTRLAKGRGVKGEREGERGL